MSDPTPADRTPRPPPLVPLADRGPVAVSLPAPLSSFVGRLPEVAAVVALLGRHDVRLATLTGPGGVGKTRLALRVAGELAGGFADGVGFVDLAPITALDLVAPTIAAALGLREPGSRDVAEWSVGALRERHLLTPGRDTSIRS